MLMLHFIGLAMGLATAFAHAFMGLYPTNSATAANETVVTPQVKALSLMGNLGLILLIISGIYLIIPF